MYLAVICDKQLITIKKKLEQKDKSKSDSQSQIQEDLEDITDEVLRTIAPLNNLKKALEEYDNQVEFLATDENLLNLLRMGKFDLILNTSDKNATNNLPAQYVGLCDLAGIPYVGSTMDSVILCKNKSLFKSILQLNHLPTPRFQIIKNIKGKKPNIEKSLEFPLIIKPIYEIVQHQSLNDKIANNIDELNKIIKEAYKGDFSSLIIEEYIVGRKFYLPIIGNEQHDKINFLPAVEYKIPENLSIEEIFKLKNSDMEIDYIEMTDPIIRRARKIARKAFSFCNCRDYAMAVFLRDNKNENIMLHELNPLSSLTSDSKMVLSSEHIGTTYIDMINDLILNALIRNGEKIRGKYSKRLKTLKKEE